MTDSNSGGKPQPRKIGMYLDESFWKILRQDEVGRVLSSLSEEQHAVLNSGMTVNLDKRHSIRYR